MKLSVAPPNSLDQGAMEGLLMSDEPGVRMQARRDLLGQDASEDEAQVLDGPMVRRLFEGQQPDGGFGVNAYSKWHGAHWRLVSLVELGIPAGEPRALAAAETVMHWLAGRSHRAAVLRIEGRVRRCASQEGNALAVMCRVGLADDPRAKLLAESLVEWQWGDGGWNCARKPATTHSSFYETATPLWGLHWPPYYGYDALWGLTLLARAGALPDKRADEAVAWLRRRQDEDGRWPVDGPWEWRSSGLRQASRDPAGWAQHGPSEMVTLNALRVLKTAGQGPGSALAQ